MGVEIERKFLVTDSGWRDMASGHTRYRQGYLTSAPECSIRVRVGGDSAWLNIKSATIGVTRSEFEYPLPLDDANQILDTLCRRPLIEKTRYLVEHAGRTWEIDVFEGDNAGLVVAELELASEDDEFALPAWAGADVSGDVRYYNQRLVEHPYSTWGAGADVD